MGDISNEPSMEEILSSIKKIIAEDSGRTPVSPRRHVPQANRAETQATVETDEDILELTESAPVDADEAPELVSAIAAEASRSALASLSRVIVKPESGGGETLEGLVREMLRPMLKEWLDSNLPGIVEGVVAREVARISGRPL